MRNKTTSITVRGNCSSNDEGDSRSKEKDESGKDEWDERDEEEEGGDRLAHQRLFCFASKRKVKSELQQRLLLGSKEEDKWQGRGERTR